METEWKRKNEDGQIRFYPLARVILVHLEQGTKPQEMPRQTRRLHLLLEIIQSQFAEAIGSSFLSRDQKDRDGS